MKKIILIGLTILASPSFVYAKKLEFVGQAESSGKIVYLEKHKVVFSEDQKILEAETRYESEAGQLLVEMKSDFRNSVAIPNYKVRDYRTGAEEGVEVEVEKIILFEKEKNKSEKKRVLTLADAKERMFVAGQGLNYYVLDQLSEGQNLQKLDLRYIFPGKLDFYDFDLKQISATAEIVDFEIKVKSWILRVFAPTLDIRYDLKKKRLLSYRGLSNIKNDQGDNQVVSIKYKYLD